MKLVSKIILIILYVMKSANRLYYFSKPDKPPTFSNSSTNSNLSIRSCTYRSSQCHIDNISFRGSHQSCSYCCSNI